MREPIRVSELSLRELYGNHAMILPQGSVYELGVGYQTDHIPPARRSDLPEYWNRRYKDWNAPSIFNPKYGVLEFTLDQIQAGKYDDDHLFRILNLSGGVSALSQHLTRLPHTHVTYVDFSYRAADLTNRTFEQAGTANWRRLVKVTDNMLLMREELRHGSFFDLILMYGVIEYMPQEKGIQQLLHAAVELLDDGGFLWYVGNEQPALTNSMNTTIPDVLGEYQVADGWVSKKMAGYRASHQLAIVNDFCYKSEPRFDRDVRRLVRQTLARKGVPRSGAMITSPNFFSSGSSDLKVQVEQYLGIEK